MYGDTSLFLCHEESQKVKLGLNPFSLLYGNFHGTTFSQYFRLHGLKPWPVREFQIAVLLTFVMIWTAMFVISDCPYQDFLDHSLSILQFNLINAFTISFSNTFSSTSPPFLISYTTWCVTMIHSNPPLMQHYGALVRNSGVLAKQGKNFSDQNHPLVEYACDLPLIDLSGLKSCDERERKACTASICRAASEWGFFQVVNHGISHELLRKMREEQVKLFAVPFEKKVTCGLLNNPYRWGTPTATRSNHFSWSEAFHIPLTMISEAASWGEFGSLRYKLVLHSSFDFVYLVEIILFMHNALLITII